MKKFQISVFFAALIIAASLNSCTDDSFTEEDAMDLQAQLDRQKQNDQDSLDKRDSRLSYTVTLVDASTSTLKSGNLKATISGAVVKLVQDSVIIVKTADASGIVTFSNIKPGTANVNVTLANYSEVNYTVSLSSGYETGGVQASNIIPLIPISGTSSGVIQGKVICESDLTNKTPEIVPAGTKVLAMVRAGSAALPYTGHNNIVAISYDNLSLSATTDANGNFSMTVPATILGLDYDITVSDFSVNQKLLQDTYLERDTFGVLTIPTFFGSSFKSASWFYSGDPVVVKVDAPDYNFSAATATAVIDNYRGLSYVQNTNVGSYYTNGYLFTMEINNPNTDGYSGSVSFRPSNGHIDAHVNMSGSKYPANMDGSTFTIPYIKVAAKAVVNAVNASGAITSYRVVSGKTGQFYSLDNLQFSKHTGSGTGAVTFLPTYFVNGFIYFSTATQNLTTAEGSGYAVGDSLILTVKSGMSDAYTGKIFLTTGSVSAINVTNEGSNYISGQVDIVISSPVTGTTATAGASVVDGKISSIDIFNGGSGYSSAPTVTIINRAEKMQAKFTANVSDGKVISFNTISSGKGYLAVPNVSITSAIPGLGTGASAYATVANGSVTLHLINQGSGFIGNNPSSPQNYTGTSYTTVKGNSTSIVNINLGTGKRSIEE